MAIKKRFINTVLNSTRKKSIKKFIKENDLLYQKSNGEKNFDKIVNGNKKLLNFYYSVIENTDFKDIIIKSNNSDYVNDKELSKVCMSEPSQFNFINTITPKAGTKCITPTQILDNSKSNDIVTKDFKDNIYAENDEIMQKVATWSNKFAHACTKEIGTIYGSMSFDKQHSKKKFKENMFKAFVDYKNDVNYSFDIMEILKNINTFSNDLSGEKNADVQKALRLIKKYYPDQLINKEFLKKVSYCLNVQDSGNDFFELKNLAMKELLLYQDRKMLGNKEKGEDPKEGLCVMSFIVKDTVKTKDGKDTCRVISINKGEYERYIRYNNNYFFTDSLVRKYSKMYNMSEEEARDILVTNASTKGKELSLTEQKALLSKCSISSYHIPDDELNDVIQEKQLANINFDCPPLLEELAHFGSAMCDIAPSQKKEEVLEKVLKQQEQDCKENEKKYSKFVDSEKKFAIDNSLEKGVIKTLERRR